MTTETKLEAVHVHITGSDVPLSQPALAPRSRGRASCRPYTVVLTSSSPVQDILDEDDSRLYALVQAIGNDCVLNNSNGEAHNAANTTTNLPDPIGMLLPSANTGPVKIPGGQRWWAAAAAYPAQVSVLVVQEPQ